MSFMGTVNKISFTWGEEKNEQNENLQQILWHCNEHLTQLQYEATIMNGSLNTQDLNKLVNKINAVNAITACINESRNESPEKRYSLLNKAIEQNEAQLRQNRSGPFIEKIKQICTLGLINLTRMVTGQSRGDWTLNKIQSEIKKGSVSLSKLSNSHTSDPSPPKPK